VVDDEAHVRRGLRMRLDLEPDIQVVGEAADGQAALDQAPGLQPDVVLMDVRMAPLNGIAATSALRRLAPACAVVILSLYDDSDTRARAQAAGAAAFVAKHEANTLLVSAIRAAARSARPG
jgi:DNA-binding NarL/FixJ family response regulator